MQVPWVSFSACYRWQHDVVMCVWQKMQDILNLMDYQAKLKTGCQASPQYKGRYCICHTPNACALDVTIDEEDALQLNGAVGPLVRHTKQPLSNPVAELIVDKKVTHPSVFVSVTCCA